eukprot:767092-Hanusia_phi.AAC.4
MEVNRRSREGVEAIPGLYPRKQGVGGGCITRWPVVCGRAIAFITFIGKVVNISKTGSKLPGFQELEEDAWMTSVTKVTTRARTRAGARPVRCSFIQCHARSQCGDEGHVTAAREGLAWRREGSGQEKMGDGENEAEIQIIGC